MVSSYELKPLGTADAWGRANTNSHGTQDPGHLGCSLLPGFLLYADLPASHRTLLNTQLPAMSRKHWLSPRHQAFAKIVSSAENTPPPWPGKILKLPALHVSSSGDEGSHYPWYPAEAAGCLPQTLPPLSESSPPCTAALLLVSLKSQNPLLLSIFTAAYETNSFLCFYSSLSLDTSPEGAKLPLIRG